MLYVGVAYLTTCLIAKRPLGNALFKEEVAAKGQTAFHKGSWHGGTLA